MISAPSTEPSTVPLPPDRLTPPITAAAITYSSMPVPSELVPAFRRATATIAAIVMVTDSSRNSCSVTRRTGMPTSRAASGLPPMANT